MQLSFGIISELPHDQTHSIEAFTGTSDLTNAGGVSTDTHGGSTFKIPTSAYGISITLTSPNVLKNNTKNLLTGFFNFRVSQLTMNWNAQSFYTTPYSAKPYYTSLQMYPSVKTLDVNLCIGGGYAHVMNNGVILGIYYGIGMSMADISDVNIGVATCLGQTMPISYRSVTVIFPQLIGLNAKYKSWFVDLAYGFYTESLDYTLPYVYSKSSGLFLADYFVTGSIQRTPIYLTLGYTLFFYPKKR